MARLLAVITVFVAITLVRGTDDLKCNKPNEERRCVAECPPQKTCRTRNIQVSCLQSAAENYQDKCVCKDGYYRNPGGECVSSEDCDKCLGQNQYYSCKVKADKLCSSFKKNKDADSKQSESTDDDNADSQSESVNEDNGDNQPESTNDDSANGANFQQESPKDTKCEAKCYCNPGTARDENNECVPYDECNQPCGQGEVKDYCPADCPSDYCPKKELKSVSCPRPNPCPKPECKCGFNSRRTGNGTCIDTRDCPPFKCRKPFEVYDPCPPLCPNGSCGQATPTGRCPPIFGNILIVLQCNPECRCKEGYWWNEDRVCIPYDQCPGKGPTTTTPAVN